jgi:hypothetical protein
VLHVVSHTSVAIVSLAPSIVRKLSPRKLLDCQWFSGDSSDCEHPQVGFAACNRCTALGTGQWRSGELLIVPVTASVTPGLVI